MRSSAKGEVCPAKPEAPGRRQADLRLLAQRLFGLLTDGHRALPYSIRGGLSIRDAVTRAPYLWSYTADWQRARERLPDGSYRDRIANSEILRRHLLGEYDVAI